MTAFDDLFGGLFGDAQRTQQPAPTLAHLRGCLTVQTWLAFDGRTRYSRVSYEPIGARERVVFEGKGSVDDAMRAAATKLAGES